MKYDDASWHCGGNVPEGLSPDAGATHTGMFVAWCMLNGLGGSLHTVEFPELLAELREKKMSPGEYFIEACTGKFTDEDLTPEGNAFTGSYFDLSRGKYLSDYRELFCTNGMSEYAVPDTWDSFDRLAPVISSRFEDWKKNGHPKPRPRPWWRFGL